MKIMKESNRRHSEKIAKNSWQDWSLKNTNLGIYQIMNIHKNILKITLIIKVNVLITKI